MDTDCKIVLNDIGNKIKEIFNNYKFEENNNFNFYEALNEFYRRLPDDSKLMIIKGNKKYKAYLFMDEGCPKIVAFEDDKIIVYSGLTLQNVTSSCKVNNSFELVNDLVFEFEVKL